MGNVFDFNQCKNFKNNKHSGGNPPDGTISYNCPGLDKLAERISNTNKILTILGSFLGIIVTILIFICNVHYNSIKDTTNANMNVIHAEVNSIKTEIKSINRRLDYQEKLNAVQIQRDVVTEVNKQK